MYRITCSHSSSVRSGGAWHFSFLLSVHGQQTLAHQCEALTAQIERSQTRAGTCDLFVRVDADDEVVSQRSRLAERIEVPEVRQVVASIYPDAHRAPPPCQHRACCAQRAVNQQRPYLAVLKQLLKQRDHPDRAGNCGGRWRSSLGGLSAVYTWNLSANTRAVHCAVGHDRGKQAAGRW